MVATSVSETLNARKSDVRLESSSYHVDDVNNVCVPTNDLRSLYEITSDWNCIFVCHRTVKCVAVC